MRSAHSAKAMIFIVFRIRMYAVPWSSRTRTPQTTATALNAGLKVDPAKTRNTAQIIAKTFFCGMVVFKD